MILSSYPKQKKKKKTLPSNKFLIIPIKNSFVKKQSQISEPKKTFLTILIKMLMIEKY